MVKVNLYRKKSQKLKLSTVLFLTLIFLLPVGAFRISFEEIIKENFEDLKTIYSVILKSNKLSLPNNLEQSIELVESRNKLLILNAKRLSSIVQSIERDLSIKIHSKSVLKTFDEFWESYTQKDKLYLKDIAFNTLKNTYSFAFYELSDKNSFNSKEVLTEFIKDLNLYPDFSLSDKVPRNFGGFMALLQKVNLSEKKPSEPSKKRK